MNCENCSETHDGSYATGRFCSTKCARGFSTKSKRLEINKKVSLTLTGKSKGFSVKALNRGHAARRANLERCLKYGPFEELSTKRKKKRLFWEQEGRCAICNCESVHNGLPLTLQLDHLDGDRTNGSRANLRMLCPNCHTQTETWGSHNARGEARERMLSGKKLARPAGIEPTSSPSEGDMLSIVPRA